MNIVIMHQTVTNHDAIGNDIEMMFHILNKMYVCYVYAQYQFNSRVKYIDNVAFEKLLYDESTILIYHHSVYWEEGEDILRKAKAKIIFRYHNITPPIFFKPYNDFAYQQCKKGREQTDRFMKDFPGSVWLSDSEYNAKDLALIKNDQIKICAPFNKIEEWTKVLPDESVLKELIETDTINLLFVGRVVPNKGHLFLLEILRVFLLNYHNKIKLRIIGKFDEGLKEYNDLIKEKIKEYQLENNVEFIGEINDATLTAYYLGSDFYICASEHEGFCVPILEAQSMMLPIISLNRGAVPDVGGKGQIVLESEAKKFAAAIKLLTENYSYYSFLQNEGIQNYNKYYYSILKNNFLEIMYEILGEEK